MTFETPPGGFHAPAMGPWCKEAGSPSYLAVAVAVMYTYFENGKKAFRELER